MTMIVVTHEMGFARDVADRVIFMDGRRHRRGGHARGDLRPTRKNPRTKEFLSCVL